MKSIQTKWRWYSCLLLLLFSFPAYTQININGRVIDEKDDSPLPGASVYFNKTTVSTYTNQQGDFHFDNINLLNTELVISCPGYDVVVFKPTAEQVKDKRLIFKLQPKKEQVQKPVLVKDSIRNTQLYFFYLNFLGVTEEAINATISNERQIHFVEADSNTSFNAYADTTLVIINNMLGYKINFDLVDFYFNEVNGRTYYFGYSHYEELGDPKKYVKRRRHTYYGSSMHFYQSLVAHQLYEQGFGAFLVQPVKDSTGVAKKRDATAQQRGDEILPTPMAAQEILYIDSTNNFSIRVAGELLVQYDKDPFPKLFLTQTGNMEGYLQKGVESSIFFKASPIELNNAGLPVDDTNIEYAGYWMYEKIANTLPINYKPN